MLCSCIQWVANTNLIYNCYNIAIIMYIYLTRSCVENQVSLCIISIMSSFRSLLLCISKSSTMDIIKLYVKNKMNANQNVLNIIKKKYFPPPLLLSFKWFHYFLFFLASSNISDKEYWQLMTLKLHELAWHEYLKPIISVL